MNLLCEESVEVLSGAETCRGQIRVIGAAGIVLLDLLTDPLPGDRFGR
jgi:hypothetical protein